MPDVTSLHHTAPAASSPADLPSSPQDLLHRIESYYDAVPRNGARLESFGPLSLFVRVGPGGPYYARPTLDWPTTATATDVAAVRARQRELGAPEAFEWVAETTPGLRAAVEESGLVVHEHPLMVHDPNAATPDLPDLAKGISLADGSKAMLRILGPLDAALASALAVPWTAFAEPGTAIGTAGPAELTAQVLARTADGTVTRMAQRIEAGHTVIAAALADGLALCSGQHQPVGHVTEIVGVGTLPSARRRGLAQAVTATLLADARTRGIPTVFLTASDEAVAHIYARLGFRRIATALIAEPA
ncbi:acetyltransferase [Kitasatospora sp. MMS16-BH015]|uniref:GNAT family N-acetyltransferase n=1 Tax=Kitasatospora sp. MMS16-BH015 TaxID=2018025 RepID=UPI000CA2FDF8|nr:GNAT family N-acetyltransferase [Kitasatospora sp. MMS16-BH015]AUG76455.1 acetyltransferase [Kitasatospora sp. MMS16-BH015]